MDLHHLAVDPHDLHAMAHAAAHRGTPNRRHHQPHAAFAHLARHPARQPLHASGHILLTADARIDNRHDLIPHLHAKGHLHANQPTDAEILLAAYQAWGTDTAEHLVGDYAFAIYDPHQHHLYAARDPMAMRPLYHATHHGRIHFASEIQQLLALPHIQRRIHEPMIAAYLAGHALPLEWTFYEGIEQLPPGHALLATRHQTRTWTTWRIDPHRRIRHTHERDYAEHFRHLFSRAVRDRLHPTRATGIMLSGGLDSGSIAATAGRLRQHGEVRDDLPIHTFSFAFDRFPEADERAISEQTVAYFGFHAHDISTDAAFPLSDHPARPPHPDEPLEGAYQPLFEAALVQARALGVGDLFSGDRGDLLVGDTVFDHVGMLFSRSWRDTFAELSAHARWRRIHPAAAYWRHLVKPAVVNAREAARTRGLLPPAAPRRRAASPPLWIRPEFAAAVDLEAISQLAPNVPQELDGPRKRRHRLLLNPESMRFITWGNRMHARHGLGFVDPFSDIRLAEFVLAIPAWVVQRPTQPKRLLREAMGGIMPEPVRRASKKTAPTVLYETALTSWSLPKVEDLLSNSRAASRGWIDSAILQDSFRAARATSVDDLLWFWNALNVERWLRAHWDRS